MFISFDRNKKEPLYKQVAHGITDKILSAEFSNNMKLPSVRELSKNLGLSHMTIVKAYELLEKDKMIVKIHGKGIFVNSSVLCPTSNTKIISSWYSSIEDYQPRALTLNLLKNTLIKKKYNLSYAMLPTSLCLDVKDIFMNVLSTQPEALMTYTETSGDSKLKKSFIQYLSKYRSINTNSKEMIIISGTQQGLSLIASVFTNSKDLIMIESPSYTGAIDAFKSSGAVIKALPICNNRLSLNELLKQCDQRPPKFVYLTPNYSNPTGYCLSKQERLELLNIAESFNFHIIEDDPWGEISFEKEPPLPIKAYDKNNRVIYIKGISKILGAGYRVSLLSASENITNTIEKAKACADLGTALLTQRLLSEVLNSPKIDTHIQNIKDFVQQRMQLTIKILRENLNKKVKYIVPNGGFNIWLKLPNEINTANILFECAYDKGITFLPGAICYPLHPHHNEIRISVSYLNDEDYKFAIMKLCKIINERLK
ncbi:PLP-dependent aminotransferase family protein [Clostridium ganghwense]|uniref:PLP-dependent aminotransferase family protein n=1 Tax=Clostridium ganghwense TaxID=312089 RepID=A0ABT4CRS4_9CLOT|nr:PLP-dependent aminotransferase family protein [Clostridium ganghwense]MCY6371742.1 PLP-dependent aminotransferase family protein [Clostridium ganghwense]